ncbi:MULTISPECIES: mycothiol conjugate amidase Mca [Candidatus Neomicrothrix]|uniref:Putative 1D-myo-inositol 2-acetamido-2-deoxy-alpha-D-glucopyranoside deacetylase n=1 Tax=Candidatus Neomicrothrix parvicella RN1 TaxID=1229780 RepID=R4Z6V6_9ACTN|nr:MULTISPECIES: mycothiol conjugate amidase Mca [Microthrix]MBP6135471.1 mycothiol conjugate amidase Mca [Candidatus Microthrix sp.]MBP6150184.1 mycothiol conjugate amidase Mca [Candidatus Microthrix sp.]MBP7403742.1 mycothiol conjugate amidase Mca [Candidatus Microthrix sp.]MBP7852770.1 mycothiol conjugate amidase Mca [Candidatus Microthrix sp.]MBP7878154.1 mycothiol conjugate amidase Mca [Candidatus Microthrix sp.]
MTHHGASVLDQADPAPTDRHGRPLRLLSIHAHPDDEASKGAGTVRRYVNAGIGATLVCCTGGEAGDILNPAMDRPSVVENLQAVRMVELGRSAQIIGYDRVELLGYRDSGMEGTEPNAHPDNFANAPFDEAVGRLVAMLRREQPQVVITYGDDQRAYGHPDHLRVHEISMPAVEAAADPAYRPELGDPHQVDKVYSTVWYRKRMEALHHAMEEAGLESPFDEEWRKRWADFDQDHRVTAFVDVSGYYWVRQDALLAHATQVDPNVGFWFGVPDEVADRVEPYDTYVLDHSVVATQSPEHDLFAGVRA